MDGFSSRHATKPEGVEGRVTAGRCRAAVAEFCRLSLGIVFLGFLLNLPWEVLQMGYYAAAPRDLALALRSHVGPALVDGLATLAIYWLGAVLFGGPRWTPGRAPGRWAFLLGAGALTATAIEWRALLVKGAWAYAPGMPLVPGLQVGLLPLLQMLLLPGVTLTVVQAIWQRRGSRCPRSGRPAAAPIARKAGRSSTPSYGALVLALGLMGVAPPALAAELAPPPSLGQLTLGHALQGDKARDEIHRLHGKAVPFRDALVAHYEGPRGVAMLYVSEAGDEATAREQVAQMTARIRNGNGTFTDLRERTQDGVTVYSTLGQGQVHYYFRRGARVIWVAADAMAARRALADVLQYYP